MVTVAVEEVAGEAAAAVTMEVEVVTTEVVAVDIMEAVAVATVISQHPTLRCMW